MHFSGDFIRQSAFGNMIGCASVTVHIDMLVPAAVSRPLESYVQVDGITDRHYHARTRIRIATRTLVVVVTITSSASGMPIRTWFRAFMTEIPWLPFCENRMEGWGMNSETGPAGT